MPKNETSRLENDPQAVAALTYDLSNMQAQASKLESSKSWTSEPGKIVHLKVDKRFSIVFRNSVAGLWG